MKNDKVIFSKALNQLQEINEWFQGDDIDLDEGLIKLRQGKDLIKQCKDRIQEVENEFIKIKEEYDSEKSTVQIIQNDPQAIKQSDDIPF